MASPDMALVKYDWDGPQQQLSRNVPDNRWLDEPSRQDFKGTFRMVGILINVLLAHLVVAGFFYAFTNWMPHPAKNEQQWVAKQDVNIRSEPRVNENTLIGICEQGTRLRVIGERGSGEKKWYEVEIIGRQTKNPKPSTRMWIAAKYVTMVRR